MKTARWTTMIVTALALVAGACARNTKLAHESANGDVSSAPGSVKITVTNNNFADMDIFAVVDGGLSLRLGTATGLSPATFSADPSMFPTGTLRLIATPIGGGGSARSGSLQVTGGQSVNFTIQPDLTTSFGTVR